MPGSCRFATTRAVASSRAQPIPRTGKHPRQPGLPAHQPLTAEIEGGPCAGSQDLSSGASAPAGSREREDLGSATSSSDPRDTDWTKWSIGASLQVLRQGSEAATLRELRRLHLRWWHASATQMRNHLAAAGLPQSILNACEHIVKTCKQCRVWQKPGRDTQATTTLATRFNEIAETDILFCHKSMIAHYIDRATRFHIGSVVPDKTEDTFRIKTQLPLHYCPKPYSPNHWS